MKKKRLALAFCEDRKSAEALFGGPTTFLDADSLKELRERYVAVHHAEEKAELDAWDENLSSVGAVLEMVNANFATTLELQPTQYENLVKGIDNFVKEIQSK